MTYYKPDLARVHHEGFGFHADACAPGILRLLEQVRSGAVVEVGCGSGLLTRHLIDAGHRVIATDASPAMIDLAREYVPEADLRVLALPDDPLPDADAFVSVGHAISYVQDTAAVDASLVAMARALQPGGVLAIDICDLAWGEARADAKPFARYDDEWALITQFSLPAPDRFVREMAIFTKNPDGTWRRDDERHENVLVDTSRIPRLLRDEGVDGVVGTSFGDEELPPGLMTLIGRKPA